MTATATRPSALVTGSSRGIGFGIAHALVESGFAVCLHDLDDSDTLKASAQTLRAQGAIVGKTVGDVSNIQNHDHILEEAEAQIGPLSLLVNNAGVSVLERGDPLDVGEASFDRCMAVNAKAVFFLCQAFAKRLLARDRADGRFYSIVNITSSNATAVAANRAEYCASKAAAAMISKTFAVRLGTERIAVYDIQPGIIATEMTAPAMDAYRQRIEDEGLTLLPDIGTPADIGKIVASLASGGLPYTTGQVIAADAGLVVQRF